MKTQLENKMKYNLPKDLLDTWTTALTDGSYEPTDGTMYDGDCDGYCALGVLAHCYFDVDNDELNLQADLAHVVGFSSGDRYLPGSLHDKNFREWVIDMNDHEFLQFDEIAERLKENVRPT